MTDPCQSVDIHALTILRTAYTESVLPMEIEKKTFQEIKSNYLLRLDRVTARSVFYYNQNNQSINQS